MRATALALSSLLALPLPAAAADAPGAFDPARSDPAAVKLADQVLEALGGTAAWNATRYLRFDWEVERGGKTVGRRSHTWDKHTGRYRLEGKQRETGKPYVVVMNLHTKEGSALADGVRLQGEELKKQLESAYGAWVNDTYWLLMPYKLKDPGVILKLDGQEQAGGRTWDKLLLTFDNVGLTPQDRYWAFVDRETHLVDRWDYVLKGEKGPATTWEWKGWQTYGRIKLANDRVNAKDGARIWFPVLETPASLDDAVFQDPGARP
jgi:hypothetical protein